MDFREKILMVEDDPTMSLLYRRYLSDSGYQLHQVSTGQDAIEYLCREGVDGVLLDLTLPDMSGLDILQYIQNKRLNSDVIIVSGDSAMSTVISAMKLGACDYLVKPFSQNRLLTTLSNCLERRRLSNIVSTYKQDLDRKHFCGFIGSSLTMQSVYKTIECAAQSKASVFISGESGTGKELCAEAVHKHSGRCDKPFIALNCAAIPRDLMESELFGHVKGAFTGALSERAGAIKAAHGGTLFLDEVCEMDLSLQSKLLRFLQTEVIQQVGNDNVEKVDVRILCASNKDPLLEVEAGRFREDLYYRLHVLPINLPPLRERQDDVIEIAQHLLSQYCAEEKKEAITLSVDAVAQLSRYSWPGNVRQLQNVMRNLVVMQSEHYITTDMLPTLLTQPFPKTDLPHFSSSDTLHPPSPISTIKPLAELEKEAIEQAIEICEGNIPAAAFHLGISTATIYRKRNQWKNEPQ